VQGEFAATVVGRQEGGFFVHELFKTTAAMAMEIRSMHRPSSPKRYLTRPIEAQSGSINTDHHSAPAMILREVLAHAAQAPRLSEPTENGTDILSITSVTPASIPFYPSVSGGKGNERRPLFTLEYL
jgi:hypothetical protein